MFASVRTLELSALARAERAQPGLRHCGPDGQRCLPLRHGNCLPGYLRLAIIDIEGGAQAMSNEDGTVWMSGNGEVYNYL